MRFKTLDRRKQSKTGKRAVHVVRSVKEMLKYVFRLQKRHWLPYICSHTLNTKK